MVDLCHSLCTMPICIWLMWTRQRTRESHHPLSSWSWLYTACGERKCVSMCVYLHVFFLRAFVQTDVCMCACMCVCIWEKEQRLHLVRTTECARIKHFCHSQVPFLTPLGGGVEPGGQRRGVPFWGCRLRREPQLKPLSPLQPSRTTLTTDTHTFV